MQTDCANHLKVLQSKVVVLNVQVKMLCEQYQVSVKKLNIIEPLMKCRKGSSSCKSQSFPDWGDITVTDSCILVTGRPALRRQELYTGFYSERERLSCWWAKSFAGIYKETVQQKFYSSYCNSILLQTGDATRSVGRSHSSDETFVMKVERRASVIQSQ